jgi:hypothetical protein
LIFFQVAKPLKLKNVGTIHFYKPYETHVKTVPQNVSKLENDSYVSIGIHISTVNDFLGVQIGEKH